MTKVCGGEINQATHGAINSPGYPGHYPLNRDCYWTISAPLGKRLQFNFATLQLEHHNNCSFDFLQVFQQLLKKKKTNHFTTNRLSIEHYGSAVLIFSKGIGFEPAIFRFMMDQT